jgi:hypothetical protein
MKARPRERTGFFFVIWFRKPGRLRPSDPGTLAS